MNLKVILLVALVLANPLIGSRIVTHFHYHFNTVSYPLYTHDNPFPCDGTIEELINDFLKQEGDNITEDEKDFLEKYAYYFQDKDCMKIIDVVTLGAASAYTATYCKDFINIINKVMYMPDKDLKAIACDNIKNIYLEGHEDWSE